MCGYFSIKVTEVVLMGPGAEELQLSRHAWFEVTRLVLKTEINSTRQTLGISLTGETSFSSLYLTIYDEVACESVMVAYFLTDLSVFASCILKLSCWRR